MTKSRRAYLTAIGAVAVSGCIGKPPGSISTNGTDSSDTSTTDGGETTDTTGTADTHDTTDGDDSVDDHLKTKLGFAGDTMVGRSLNDKYGDADTDPATIWGDFQSHLESLDGVLCNLECCLSKRGERFPDRAYYFRGDPDWAVPALNAGNIRFTTLSNNHAMDFGSVALTDTIDALDAGGIDNAGTGKTPAAAWEPATFSVGGLDVAVVSFSDEYKVYAASSHRPGIAWAETDPESSRTQRLVGNAIERARSVNPDLLVVSLHWGENWIERPTDRLVTFGHWLVEQGADLVHGHSAHLVQAVEQYGDGVILHDTGNLVDDFGTKGDLGNHDSFLFELALDGGEFERVRLVPFHIDDGVFPSSDDEAEWLRETMRDRSKLFGTTYERDGNGLVVEL